MSMLQKAPLSRIIPLLILLASLLAAPGRPPAQAADARPQDVPLPAPFTFSDEQFVSGALRGQTQIERYLRYHGGFLADISLEPTLGKQTPAAEGLAFLGEVYSVSPALLLILAAGSFDLHLPSGHSATDVSDAAPTDEEALASWFRWTAMTLSRWFYDHYYGHDLPLVTPVLGESFHLNAGNAATYALRSYFFAEIYTDGDPREALAAWEQALTAAYAARFAPPLAGRLHARHPTAADLATLPPLRLPWTGGDTWYYTGGPHNFDGSNRLPLSGVDFQPAGPYGCNPEVALGRWVVAAAPGRTIDYQSHWLKLDHDHDGDANTGWQTVYGHLANRAGDDVPLRQGHPLGNPSCYGGFAGGVHVHFGLKFQNVWQPAEQLLLSGWTLQSGLDPYHGAMTKPGYPDRQSCFHPDRPNMDCAHAALTVHDNGFSSNGYRSYP